MLDVEQLIITALTLAFPPFMLWVLALILFSSLGWNLGIREHYVQVLLKLFEWGRQKIEMESTAYSNSDARSGDDGEENVSSDNESPADMPLEVSRKPSSLLIHKKTFLEAPTAATLPESKSGDIEGVFQPGDIADYLRWGMEAITEDEVTKRFSAAELSSWNLLTRTNQQYHYLSLRLTILWAVGCIFRYTMLLPLRVTIHLIATLWLAITTACIGYIPDRYGRDFKRRMNRYISLMYFRMCARSLSCVAKYHDVHNRPRENAICVANHTSPIDVIVLASDNCYGVVGQRHKGFSGFLQRAQSRGGSEHIWFERSETKDREAVTRKLKAHINGLHALPILVFPEGTCVNNTSVMMFKKGSFELDCDVYPVVIKYDQRFGDAFWDSSKQNFIVHLYRIMTSWALVVDVVYLPPVRIRDDEDSTQFANRVKKQIASRGGFVDLDWDGALKRSTPKAEWKHVQQKFFSERLRNVG